MNELGRWIKDKYGSQAGLADALGVQQSRVSKWVSGAESISDPIQAKLRGMKYKGPWPREQAQAPAVEATPREDYWKLVGRVEALERALERLSEGFRHHMTKEPEDAHPQEPA